MNILDFCIITDGQAMKNCFLLMALFLIPSLFTAKENDKIRILDKETSAPVQNVSYKYSDQTGKSNEEGMISFDYIPGETLYLSHISYGTLALDDTKLKEAIEKEFIYWKSKDIDLYPVTVIALRSRSDETEVLDLDYQDKMDHDGGAILRHTPAVNMIKKSGNYGFDPVLRGFKYDQLNVVIDGTQYASAACPNRMDPATSQIAPNMVEKVEIIKGPHSLRYGSSFGGTINYVPAEPRYSGIFSTYGRISGGFESNGSILRSEGLVGFTDRSYDLGIYASWSQGRNYVNGEGNSVAASFLRGSFGADLDVKITDQQEMNISATRNLTRDTDFPALPMDLIDDDTWLLNLGHKIKLDIGALSEWNTKIYGSAVDHYMNNFLKNLDPRKMNAETTAKTRNFGGRTETEWLFENDRMYIGADLRYENATGTRKRDFLMGPNAGKSFKDKVWQNSNILKSGFFAEYQYNTDNYIFIFSGRLEMNSSDLSDPADEFTEIYNELSETQFNPSISLGSVRSFGEYKFGLWLGRAQRSGSLTERFINYFPVGLDPYEMLGNPQLEAEINNQADLTFEWNRESSKLNLDFFTSYLQDYISSEIDTSLTPRMPGSPGVRQFRNIGDALKAGFEMNWIQDVFMGMQFQISMAYTYGQDLENNEPLPEIAPLDFRYVLSGHYFGNRLHPEVYFRHCLEQTRVSKEYGESETPAFSVVNFRISYDIYENFKMTLGVNNLFDEEYYEHLSRSVRGKGSLPIYEPGRSVYVSMNMNLN